MPLQRTFTAPPSAKSSSKNGKGELTLAPSRMPVMSKASSTTPSTWGCPPWTRTYDGGGNGSMAKRYGDWRSIAQYAPRDIKLYVDESSDWVIDIWWDGRSAAYRLRTDWRSHGNGRDIQFAEALAIEVGLLHVFATGLRSAALIVYTDNTGVPFGVPRGRMRNEAATIVIERIHDLQVRHDVVVHTRRVASADNPADEPSRPFPQSYFPLALPRSSFPTRSHPRTDIGKDKQHVKKARIPERSQSSRPSLAALRAARQKTMKIQAASAPSAASNRRRSTPQPLTVARSSLRPDFLAHQRLSSWRPVTALQGTHLSFEEVASVSAAVADSYSEDTLKSYGSGLARWHQWCDHPGVPEQLRCPAPAELLKSFILQHTGHFSSDTIGTWLSGLRAWHRIWNQSWPAGNMRRTELIRYAALHTPSTSRNPARPAVTLEWLSAILSVVKLNSPGNVAAAAAASVALWGLLRLGETKCLPKNFDQRKNISRTGVTFASAYGGVVTATLSLPFTKTSPHGQRVVLTEQPSSVDPLLWLRRHLALNTVSNDEENSLFAFRYGRGVTQMRRKTLTSRLQILVKRADLPVIDGHSFRIGGCTELLRAGNAFDDVHVHGRWSSEAWQRYVRDHAEIMAARLHLDDTALSRLVEAERERGVGPRAGAVG